MGHVRNFSGTLTATLFCCNRMKNAARGPTGLIQLSEMNGAGRAKKLVKLQNKSRNWYPLELTKRLHDPLQKAGKKIEKTP